jgi:hypothetical protein
VNVSDGPEQETPPLINVGVTVIVDTTGLEFKLEVINVGIFPVPDAAKPIEVLEFVQLYVVNPTELAVEKDTLVESPLQTTCEFGRFTWATGLTVTVYVFEGPVQIIPALSKDGVTVIVDTKGAVPVFVAIKAGTSPVPLLMFKPVDKLSLVHVYVVVPTVFEVLKLVPDTEPPSQTTTETG